MPTSTEHQKLLKLFDVFGLLNPDHVQMVEHELFALARQLGPESFPEIADKAREVLRCYLDSPLKSNERDLLREYYYFVNQASRRLLAEGELAELPPPVPNQSLALLPAAAYSPFQWLQVTSKAGLPDPLTRAVDAVQRRHQVVDSVLETLFSVLLELDREQAFAWQLDLTGSADQPVDPDLARDLLRAWQREDDVPVEALQRALRWSEDEQSFRHWPAVTLEADALLNAHWLRRWMAAGEPRTSAERVLRYQQPFRNSDHLLRWLKGAIEQMGMSIDFFSSQAEALTRDHPPAEDDWRRAALFRELVMLHRLLPLMLVQTDLILNSPNGAFEFAQAIFGFTNEHRRSWQAALIRQSQKAVRRFFLNDLKLKRKPLGTIRRLCFGDEALEVRIVAELDLISGEFDSVKQLDLVAEQLCGMYASYREGPLMAQEIGRRYRRTMGVLHEDNLRRLLSPEQLAELAGFQEVLLDLATIAAESRRFLSQRRALERTVEELMAIELEYLQRIRAVRARYLRAALVGD